MYMMYYLCNCVRKTQFHRNINIKPFV